jgi:DNA-binding NarL/FixJ family response regulator
MSASRLALLIEDDPVWARQLEITLSEYFVTDVYRTLTEGLDAMEALEPDVIVLNLNLPDSRGTATLVEVQERHPNLPIIVCSGFAEDAAVIRAGAVGVIHKDTFMPAEAIRTVEIGIGLHEVRPHFERANRKIDEALAALPILGELAPKVSKNFKERPYL